ncbi:MAG: hypothetical protein HYX93_05160 [Chloroflexi bacterium]|nr:hypothetical protein [Chloroflexota bacterium]
MATERPAIEVPFPDPLGFLQGEAEALRAPVVPVDPLVGLCRRWLGGIFEAREKAVQNYAKALEGQPLSPEARARAITNYDMALRTRFGPAQ